ncbi:pathogenesis-related protein STH-21-like [Corylus avellana]|uniref:pathogenesis-related protein STH-21-like n=1 Tax=Corylus avellana TaxID=13451 RepID=UPI001E23BF64|nr:pathogenesis-related protein STH-21-like [Corylus avellana]
MAVTKITQTFATRVTPDRMFKALILDSHNICPKLMFSSIKSIEFVEGSGEVVSIKRINFTEGKGGPLMEKLEYISYELKSEGYGRGGCVCKMSSEYKAMEGIEIKEEDIEFGKDRAIGMYEVVRPTSRLTLMPTLKDKI